MRALLVALVCTGAALVSCASAHLPTPAGGQRAGLGTGEAPFLLAGYVVDIERCPRCPPGSDCENCVESLIVSNQPNPTDRHMVADGNVRVLVSSAASFSIGRKVSMQVQATANQPFQDD